MTGRGNIPLSIFETGREKHSFFLNYSRKTFKICLFYTKFKSNHQENLENKISNHRIFSMILPIVFIYFYFVKKYIQPPAEHREHRLSEVLQGRSKSKFNIILSYLIVLFFWVQVCIIIMKLKKILLQNYLLQ